MHQIYLESNIPYKSAYQVCHTSVAMSGHWGDLGRGEEDLCNFGGGCKISTTDDITGTLAANVLPYCARRLNEICSLPDDWDGQGTAAPNKMACFHASEVIYALNEINLVPTKLMPSADEGIGFYFSKKNKYGLIECYNDGEIIVVMSDRKGYRKVTQVENTAEIKDELETLRVFINAS